MAGVGFEDVRSSAQAAFQSLGLVDQADDGERGDEVAELVVRPVAPYGDGAVERLAVVCEVAEFRRRRKDAGALTDSQSRLSPVDPVAASLARLWRPGWPRPETLGAPRTVHPN
jgi:hypothetical protein